MYALDLSVAHWRKSSRSSDTSNCVEIAYLSCTGCKVGVRDSKNAGSPVLAFPARSWVMYLATGPGGCRETA